MSGDDDDARRERVFRRVLASMPVNHAAANDAPVSLADALSALRFDYPQLTQKAVDALAAHVQSSSLEQRQRELPLSPQLLERVDYVASTSCNVDALRSALLVHAVPALVRLAPVRASVLLATFVAPTSERAFLPSALDSDAAPLPDAPVELVAAEQDGDDYVFEDYDSDASSSSSSSSSSAVVAVVDDAAALALWPERVRHFAQHVTYERVALAWQPDAVFGALDALLNAAPVDEAWLDALLPRLCFVVRDRCVQHYGGGEELTRLLRVLLDAPAPRSAAVAERCAHLAVAVMTSMTTLREAAVARHVLERLPFLAARAAVPNVHATQLTSLARIVVHGVALDERVGAALLPSRFVHTYLRFFLESVRGGPAATLQLTLRGAWPRADADDLEGEALLLVAAHVPKVLDFLLAVPEFVGAVAALGAAHAAWFGAWMTLRAWHAQRTRGAPDAFVKALESAVLAPLSADAPVAAARVIEWQSALLRIAHEQSHGSTSYWTAPLLGAVARLQPLLASRLAAEDERERGNVLRLQRALKSVPRGGSDGGSGGGGGAASATKKD